MPFVEDKGETGKRTEQPRWLQEPASTGAFPRVKSFADISEKVKKFGFAVTAPDGRGSEAAVVMSGRGKLGVWSRLDLIKA
jgi:hypothetical protein